MKFTLTIPVEDHKKARSAAIAKLAPNVTIKGFRKGKAPIDKVEQQLDESSITEQTVNSVFPSAFRSYILENKLEPIGDPSVSIVSLEAEKDWVFDVEISEKPTVTLGNYIEKVKSVTASAKIILPQDDAAKNPSENEEKLINNIIDALIKEVIIEVPSLLVDQEVNRRMSTLVKQITDMGLTVDNYLKSQNITKDQLREQYALSVETNLKIDFIVEAISSDLNISTSDKELEDQINTISNPNERKHVQESEVHRESLRYSLTRNKVIRHLISL